MEAFHHVLEISINYNVQLLMTEWGHITSSILHHLVAKKETVFFYKGKLLHLVLKGENTPIMCITFGWYLFFNK